MSSPMHCHNPYQQQAVPNGYLSAAPAPTGTSYIPQQRMVHQLQMPFYPTDVEVHTQRRSSNNSSGASCSMQQYGGPNFSHGVQHGYHSHAASVNPNHQQYYQNNSHQQQQHAAPYSSYDHHPHQQQQYYSSPSYQGSDCGGAGSNFPYAGSECTEGATTACFPTGVMETIIDSGKKTLTLASAAAPEEDGEGGDGDDCNPNACIPSSAAANLGMMKTTSAPPVYSDFSSTLKGTSQQTLMLDDDDDDQQDTISTTGAIDGESSVGVMKTTENVVRNELNGRVPYLHFPPVAEMLSIVTEAKELQATEDLEYLAENPNAMTTPDGKLKKSYLPVFFGQVLFSTTQTHLSWLLLHLTGLLPTAVSNHSPGCFTCYFTSMEECNSVLSLNKRLLFDAEGVWAAQTRKQTDLVYKSANLWRQKQQQQGPAGSSAASTSSSTTAATAAAGPRLPRGAMVVELPMHGGGGGGNHNNHNANRPRYFGGNYSNRNNSNNSTAGPQARAGVSRMR